LERTLRIFRPGEEVEMVQWGRAGEEVDTDSWWTTSQYIPAAHIVPADKVEVLEVLEGRRPETDADAGSGRPPRASSSE
jgi:hypothetical protein